MRPARDELAARAGARHLARNEARQALVLWRVRDPDWPVSFAGLLDDARACIDPDLDVVGLLRLLREALILDPSIAPRAGELAVQARQMVTDRLREGRPVGPTPRRETRVPARKLTKRVPKRPRVEAQGKARASGPPASDGFQQDLPLF